MSAPILTCALLDAAGPLLKEAQLSLKPARVHVSYFPPDELGDGEFFNVTIHDDELGPSKCFGGNGPTPAEALMKANGDRQAFAEKLQAESRADTTPPVTGEIAP